MQAKKVLEVEVYVNVKGEHFLKVRAAGGSTDLIPMADGDLLDLQIKLNGITTGMGSLRLTSLMTTEKAFAILDKGLTSSLEPEGFARRLLLRMRRFFESL